jgi:hypothetical protein
MALLHPKGVNISDRTLAEYVGVHNDTVGRIRKELELTVGIRQSTKRVGKDGRVTETKNIGRTYTFDEEQEPETNYRTNADGKMVNVRGFDFTAHRKCEECIK